MLPACPNRTYSHNSKWRPPPETVSAAKAECPSLADQALRLGIARTDGGCYRMALLARADIVSRSIFAWGVWEKPSVASVVTPHTLPDDCTLLDIGANLGWFTMLFAQAGCKVYAVEAFPQNQRALKTTLCLNPSWASRVTLAPYALGGPTTSPPCVVRSDRNGGRRNNNGNGIVTCGPSATCAGESLACEQAELRTLDTLLSGEWAMPRVDVVKVDVEGFECEMLAGGQLLLTSIRPKFIIAEMKFGRTAKCWQQQAALHGYTIERVDPGNDRNTLFVRSDAPPGTMKT